ncbi:MAG: hypothetical protein AB7F32_01020 [Victivallaceae bacterium]
MSQVRFITVRTTVAQYGAADFTITAAGSLAVNDASSAYALNLQGVSGDRRKLIADGAISLVTRNAAGTAVLFATGSGEALDGVLLFDLKNPAVTVSVDTGDASAGALARGISGRSLVIGRDPGFVPAIPGRIAPWRAALSVSALHRNGEAEAAGVAAAGTLEIAALLTGVITVRANAETDAKSAVPSVSGDVAARGLSSTGAMTLAGIDNSFKLTVAASASRSVSAEAEAYGFASDATLTVEGDFGGTCAISAFGGGTGDGAAKAYGIAGDIAVTVGGALRTVLGVSARASTRGSGGNDALAYGVTASLFSAAEVADGCRMTVNATAGQGASAVGKAAAFYIDGGLLSVAGRLGGTYIVSAVGGLGGYGAGQAFGIYAAGISAGVLAGSWTVSARGGGVNGNVSGFAEACGVKSTGSIILTGGTDKNYRLTVSATGATGQDASAAAIGLSYAEVFTANVRFGGVVTVSATGAQATGVADSQAFATAIGVSGGSGRLALSSLGGVFNITARSGRDATSADAFAAGIFANGALSIGSAEKTLALTVKATSVQGAGFTSGTGTACGLKGVSLAVAGAWLGTFNISAAGGKGTEAYAEACALRTSSGEMSFGTFGGTYLVTARGGAGDGAAGSSSHASATGLSCSGGNFSATLTGASLRFTVNATAGSGGENASGAATGIYTDKSVNIASDFAANLQVTAIAGKSSGGNALSEAYGLRFDKAADDVSVAAATVAGMLGGNFAVRASGGSGGDDVIVRCYGIRSAIELGIGSIDAKFVLTASATGGTGKQATVVLHGIRSDATLTIAGTVGGTYAITGVGGTGTGGGSANLNMTGISGKTGVTLGDFAATFRMTVTGSAGKGSFVAANSNLRGIDSGAGMTLGALAGSIAVTANGNRTAGGTLLEAYGISALGDLSTGAWSKNFSLVVTVNGQQEYSVNGYGISASGAILIAKLAGALTVTVNGGNASAGPVGGYGILAFEGISIAALELNSFRLTVRSSGGYGENGSAVAYGVQGRGLLAFSANAAGNWTVEARARGNNQATMAAASARAAAIEAVAGNIVISEKLSGTFRVVAAASASTGDSGAQAMLIRSSGSTVVTNGIGAGSSLTVLASGGTGRDASAQAILIDGGGNVTLAGTLFGTASVAANGGRGSIDSSAEAYGFRSGGTLDLGQFDRTFRLTVSADGGSGSEASATAAGVTGYAVGIAALAGRFEVTARGKNNAGSAAATAFGLQSGTDLALGSVDTGFYLAVTATAGNGLNASASAGGMVGSGIFSLPGGFAGTLSVNATAGVGTAVAGGSSRARARGLWNDGGETAIGGLLAGNWTVNAKGGSKSAAGNEAEAIGILAGTIALTNAFDPNFRLAVSATGGTGAAATASAGGIRTEAGSLICVAALGGNWTITARGGFGPAAAAATASGLSGATGITLGGDAATFKLTVNATGGSGFDASAEAYGFTCDGDFAPGTLGGNYQVKAQGGNGLGNGSPEASAKAVWIDAGSTASLTAGGKLVVNVVAVAGSAVDAEAEAAGVDGAGEVTLNALGGNWTVAATGGRSGSSGSAAAYGIRSGTGMTVAAVDPALQMTVTATGGSAYGNTNAWAAGLLAASIDITSPVLGGSWAISVTAGIGEFSAQAIGAWISSAPLDPGLGALSGRVNVSAMLTAKVSVTVKGGSGSNAPQWTAAYGIRSLSVLRLTGGVSDAFMLTVSAIASSRYASTATAAAYGVICETDEGVAAEISGSIAGGWTISSTGGNALQDGGASAAGFYHQPDTGSLRTGDFVTAFAMTVKAQGGRGNNAGASARGIFAGGGLITGNMDGRLTVAAIGGNASVLSDAAASGLTATTVSCGNFGSAAGITVTATGGGGLAAAATASGVMAAGEILFGDFAGTIQTSATGGKLSAGSGGDASGTATGMQTGADILLASFAGNIKAVAKGGTGSGTNHAYAFGLKAGTTLTVSCGVVAGSLSATATAGARADATAAGIAAASLGGVTDFAGKITATANGLAAAAAAGAWGVKIADFGGLAVTVSGVIAAAGNSRAVGISGNNLNLTVTGVIYAGKNGNADTLANTLLQLWNKQGSVKGYLADVRNLNGAAIAIRGGSGMDTVKLGAGALVIGDIDFGTGSDVLMISSGAQLAGSLKVDASSDHPLAWTYLLDTAASKNAIVTLPGGLDDALQGSTVSVKLETGRIGEYILLEGGSGINISVNVGGQVIAVGESYLFNGVAINYYRKALGGGRDQLILSVQPAPEPLAATGGNDWGGSAVADAAGSVAESASLAFGNGASAPGGGFETLDAGLTSDLNEYAAAAATELNTAGQEDAARKYGLLAAIS